MQGSSIVAQISTADDIVARMERIPPTRLHLKARIIMGTATFFDAFDMLAISSMLPVLVGLWHLNPNQIGFIIAVGFAGQVLGALIFTRHAERYGRVSAAKYSILLFSIMSLVCALAWSYESLCIFRFAQGIGLGGEVPVAATYINELSRARRRGRFVLVYELVFPIGIVASTIVGSWLVPAFGWQSMYILGAAPALLLIGLRRNLPESPRWHINKGELEEADRITRMFEESAGPAALEAPISSVPAQVAPQAAFSWMELLRPPYLTRTLVIWINWCATAVISFALGVWITTIYRTVFHLSIQDSLRLGIALAVCALVGSTLCAFLIDAVGRKLWLIIAQFVAATAVLVVGLASAPSVTLVAICASIAYGASSSTAMALFLYTPECYPTRFRAVGTGAATAWLRGASIVAPLIVGAILTNSSLDKVFLFYAAAAYVASLAAFFGIETKEKPLESLSR
jgi:MFS transporter, putative metabolite:H+ symporter